MAYVSNETKARIASLVKAVLKAYGMTGTIAVSRSRVAIEVNIKGGHLDIVNNFNRTVKAGIAHGEFNVGPRAYVDATYLTVTHHGFGKTFSGAARSFIGDLFNALHDGNHDNSHIESDYFDVGWYASVNFGKWNAPYVHQCNHAVYKCQLMCQI